MSHSFFQLKSQNALLVAVLFTIFSPLSAQSKPKTEMAANKADLTKTYDLANKGDPIVKPAKSHDDAFEASLSPNAHYVSVYLMVGKQAGFEPEELAVKMKSYFNAYNLPVQFFAPLENSRPLTNGSGIVIYVGGGDNKTTVVDFFKNHAEVFKKLIEQYSAANKPENKVVPLKSQN